MRAPTALAIVCLAAACSSEGQGRPADAADSATEELPVRRLEGTPEGNLTDWVADMKAGLDTVVTVAARDRAGAQRAVLDAYVNRQEWLERYYGRYGSLQEDTTSALGDAVMDAEARFHDLLTLVSAETVDTAQLTGAVAAVNAELDRVLEEAGRTEVPPVPAREGTE
jgi:hypothetical protein